MNRLTKKDWEDIFDSFYDLYLLQQFSKGYWLIESKEQTLKSLRFKFYMLKVLVIGFFGLAIQKIK